MKTKNIVEDILYRSDNRIFLMDAFRFCKILTPERIWSPAEHTELKFVSKNFLNPKIICLVSKIISIYIIGEKIGRKYEVLLIRGNETLYYSISKSKLIQICNKELKSDEFLPDSVVNRIFWIVKENSIVFSEYQKNKWTLDPDISNLKLKTSLDTTSKKILIQLIDEI